jgi:hypothetical protein
MAQRYQEIEDSKGRQGDRAEEEKTDFETEVMHDGTGNGQRRRRVLPRVPEEADNQ